MLSLDSGEIGDRARRRPDFVEELQPVLAQRLVIDVDGHLVKERIDMRPQLRHCAHGGSEILGRDRTLRFRLR